jgi:thiol-disulfide isomerase/thioredoxin
MTSSLKGLWRRLRKRYWVALLMDVALIVGAFWAISAWQTRDLPGPGQLPALQAAWLEEGVESPPLPGSGVGVVYFFAPWCFYCKHSIGHIDELVLDGEVAWARAVALDYESLDEVRDFLAEVDLQQPVLLGTSEVAAAWNIRAFPTYFVIDEKGGISSRSVGYATKIGLKTRVLLARE